MLDHKFGRLVYFLLQYRLSYGLLSASDKILLKEMSSKHNVEREDYRPECYANGSDSWTCPAKVEKNSALGFLLSGQLTESQSFDCLEIGPGTGGTARQIFERCNVLSYTAAEINPNFSEYLTSCFANSYPNLNVSINCTSFENYVTTRTYNLILLNSVLHHLVDRDYIFMKLKKCLRDGGVIVISEPAHYIPRIFFLIKKILFEGLISKAYWENKVNWSVHGFCTLSEIERYCSAHGMELVKSYSHSSPRFRHFGLWFSSRISVIVRKSR